MTAEQQKIIAAKLNDLTHITQGEVTPQRLILTLDVLSKFGFEEICAAIEKGKHLWTFYPSPAQILEEMGGDIRSRLWVLEMKQKKQLTETKKKELA